MDSKNADQKTLANPALIHPPKDCVKEELRLSLPSQDHPRLATKESSSVKQHPNHRTSMGPKYNET